MRTETLYEQIAALDSTYHMRTYSRYPVLFVRGDGMRLYDDQGREFLDFVAGIGAVNLGHAHPAVTQAVAQQMAKLVHVSNLYHVEHRDYLAARLSELAGGGWSSFFCNSGTEAVEGAIKLARRWGKDRKGAECYRIVAARRSFHGRTMGSLSATGQPSKQEAFAPLLPGFTHVALNDLEALSAALTLDTCAVLLETVQGEGGVHPCDESYLRGVRELCDERGVLLMLDEVQCGCFRTGPAFAWQDYGIRPDVITLAKSLANGLPIGALMACGSAAEAFAPGDHGSTFGGGPVVCAAALATLDALEAEGLGDNARKIGAHLMQALRGLGRDGAIVEVRGRGLMIAAELAEPKAKAVAAACLERGLLVNAVSDSVLRFLPPLICGRNEVDVLLDALEQTIGAA